MSKSLLRLVLLSTPFLLTACGEGWEVQRTDAVFPYGNQRTAGSGVVYVRAKMLPKKEIIAPEPVLKEENVEAAPVLDAEEIFTEAQTKGGKSAHKKIEKKDVVEKKADEHSSNTGGSMPNASVASIAPEDKAAELSAEAFISQAPKQIEIPHVVDVQPASGIVDIEDAHKASSESVDIMDNVADKELASADHVEETVEVYENKVAQPIKEIVVPKRDFFDFDSKGQDNLDEIYTDPFAE